MKRIIVLIMFLIVSTSITGCIKTKVEDETPDEKDNTQVENNKDEDKSDEEVKKEVVPSFGGELSISVRNPQSLNPLLNEDRTVDSMLKLVYDSLFELDEAQKPVKSLAESYELSETGTYITLKLKDNIVFHDGSPLLAEDVVYSIDTIIDAESSIYKRNVANIKRTSVIDETTCRIYYTQPYSFNLYDLIFPIIKKGVDHNNTPVGTGAYKFVNYDSMKDITLTANKDWFKGNLYVENIKAVITRDPDVDISSFEQKVIDLLNPSKFDWQQYAQKSDVKLTEYITYYYDFIGFNFNNEVLADANIRKAIAYTVDREKVIKDYYMNHAVLTEYPIHPSSWLSNDSEMVYSYNIDQAKELISNSGWEDSDEDGILDKFVNGIKVDLKLSLLVNANNPIRVGIAENIKESLEKAGFAIDVESLELEAYNTRLLSNDFDLAFAGYKLSPIPDFTFAFHSESIENGVNFIHYKSDKMDNVLADTFNAANEESFVKAIKEFKSTFVNDLPYLSLYFRTSAILTNDTVYGEIKPTTYNNFKGIQNLYLDY